ncbi:MAG: hypothetical protein WAT12_08460 [Candidatus Nitrotoga sp.]
MSFTVTSTVRIKSAFADVGDGLGLRDGYSGASFINNLRQPARSLFWIFRRCHNWTTASKSKLFATRPLQSLRQPERRGHPLLFAHRDTQALGDLRPLPHDGFASLGDCVRILH